ELLDFVDTVAAAGVSRFTVHARKAWLQGLSPRQNREVPPLRYDVVRQLAELRPELEFEINGGITTLEQARDLIGPVRAVRMGRAVAAAPRVLAEADRLFFGSPLTPLCRGQAVRAWLPYVEKQLAAGVPFRVLARPLLGMFTGMRGARGWRRELSEAS